MPDRIGGHGKASRTRFDMAFRVEADILWNTNSECPSRACDPGQPIPVGSHGPEPHRHEASGPFAVWQHRSAGADRPIDEPPALTCFCEEDAQGAFVLDRLPAGESVGLVVTAPDRAPIAATARLFLRELSALPPRPERNPERHR